MLQRFDRMLQRPVFFVFTIVWKSLNLQQVFSTTTLMRTLKKIPIMMVACLFGVTFPMKGGTEGDAPPMTHQVINDTTVNSQTEPRLLSPSRTFFVPHWYVKAQGGAAYDVGEARFHELLSPAFQLSMGYQPAELIGVRGSLGGLWARNRYAYPEAKYQWNFLQVANPSPSSCVTDGRSLYL